MNERTIKRTLLFGAISIGLVTVAALLPTGIAKTVLVSIAFFGAFGSGLAIAYHAITRLSRCP